MLKVMRVILTAIIFLGGSLIILLISLLNPFNPKMALLFTRYITPLAQRTLGIKVEYRHHERMKNHHPCVYIANHQHAIDLIVCASTLVVPTVAIGKKELKWIPFFGWLFWLTGQIMIDRKHNQSAVQTMTEAAKIMKERQVSVWVFPEGTRSQGKSLQPFKKGAFYLAIQAQVPIVPLAFSSYVATVNLNKWKSGSIIMEALPPIPTQDLTIDEISTLIDKCFNILSEKISLLDTEIAKGRA